jgi:hypothetical protein
MFKRAEPIKRERKFETFFLNWYSGGWSPIGSTWHCGHQWPIVPATGDYDDGEIRGMIRRGNRSTRRKSASVPLCPPQTPHAARTRTRAAAVGSQRLTAWATARPIRDFPSMRKSVVKVVSCVLRHDNLICIFNIWGTLQISENIQYHFDRSYHILFVFSEYACVASSVFLVYCFLVFRCYL